MSKDKENLDRWDDGDDEGTYTPRTGKKKVHRPSSHTQKPVSKKSEDFSKPQYKKGTEDQGYANKKSFDQKPSYDKKRSFDDKRDADGKSRSFDGKKRFDRDDKRDFGGKKSFEKRGSYNDRGNDFGKKKFSREDDNFRGNKNRFDRDDKRDFGGKKPFEKRGSYNDRGNDFGKKSFNREGDNFRGNKNRFDRQDSSYNKKKDFGNKPFEKEGEEVKGYKRFGKKKFDDPNRPYTKDDPTRSKLLKRKSKRKHASKVKNEASANIPEYDFKKINKFKQGYQDKKGNLADQEIRLNRYISNAGICSRREADDLIANGEIKVNGKVVTELGTKVKRNDDVVYKGKSLSREKKVYVLLNKPKNHLTTMDDPQGRRTVMDLVGHACEERIYPVGRLDRNTTGILLFTNDGELATALAHPSSNVKKVYRVELNKPISAHDFDQIANGVELEDGFMKPDNIALNELDPKILGIEIHSGKNRIVRRLFEHFGYEVERLDRTAYAGLTKKDIPRGKWRFLKQSELIRLKHFEKFK